MWLIVILILILLPVQYYIIRDAVQEGVFRALKEYGELKDKSSDN